MRIGLDEPDCGGNELPICALIPIRFAAVSSPDCAPDLRGFAMPIRGMIAVRLALLCGTDWLPRRVANGARRVGCERGGLVLP